MNDKLAVLSKAKTALAKADTFEEVVKIRNSAKAVVSILKDTLETRDRALEAQAIELLAEHKAGRMLGTLSSKKAGSVDNPELSAPKVCEDAGVKWSVARHWRKLAEEDLSEEQLAKYVEFVQNNEDPTMTINLQGFRRFCTGVAASDRRGEHIEWAIRLLNNMTKIALDLAVEESLKGATKAQATNLKLAKEGILEKGYITRG